MGSVSERFVVGTGRCGSTLLSTMLSKHPDALVLSEFFGGVDRPRSFSLESVSGAALAAALSRSQMIADWMRAQSIETKEQLYDFDKGAASRDQPEFSPILYVCLPFLTDHPDALLREIFQMMRAWPVRAAHDHFVELFAWLQRRAGKSLWIERSGTSWEFFPLIRQTFPNAKYVHIHRDGLEAALSMSVYPFLQIAGSLFAAPPDADETQQIAARLLDPSPANPLNRRLASLPPISTYGEYWSWQVAQGFSAMPKVRPEQYLDVRFEDLLAEPHAVLEQIADFFEMPPAPGWTGEAVKLITGDVGSRFHRLSVEDQAALEHACRPGNVLLGRRGNLYFQDLLDEVFALRNGVAA